MVNAPAAMEMLRQRAYPWFVANHLLVFLFLAFLIGLTLPDPGIEVSKPKIDMGKDLGTMRAVQFCNVVLIFLISGFRLKTDAAIGALRQPMALGAGLFSILVWTPLMGLVTSNTTKLWPKEFAYGLTLFCTVPTTLTSGAALVAGCKGANRATELALMITVSSNLLGCFTTPLWLSAFLSSVDVKVNVPNLLMKLMLSLLLPTFIGKAAQVLIPGAAKFSKDWKTPLTIFSNFNLVFVVWQSVSRAQSKIKSAEGWHLLLCIVAAIVLHVVFWVLNSPIFLLPRIEDMHHRRAAFLLGSQKTLPVSVAIISGLGEEIGDGGLMALPCIFGHLSQLVIDAFLVDYWAKREPEAAVEAEVDLTNEPQAAEAVSAEDAVIGKTVNEQAGNENEML